MDAVNSVTGCLPFLQSSITLNDIIMQTVTGNTSSPDAAFFHSHYNACWVTSNHICIMTTFVSGLYVFMETCT